jgi:hypothetical protein
MFDAYCDFMNAVPTRTFWFWSLLAFSIGAAGYLALTQGR